MGCERCADVGAKHPPAPAGVKRIREDGAAKTHRSKRENQRARAQIRREKQAKGRGARRGLGLVNSENHDLEGTGVTPQLPKSGLVPEGPLGGSRHYAVHRKTEIVMQIRAQELLLLVLTYRSLGRKDLKDGRPPHPGDRGRALTFAPPRVTCLFPCRQASKYARAHGAQFVKSRSPVGIPANGFRGLVPHALPPVIVRRGPRGRVAAEVRAAAGGGGGARLPGAGHLQSAFVSPRSRSGLVRTTREPGG
ncbi:hypothetical protein LEMLEM_LOCUS32 [Lemmus lemmus]